MSELNNFQKEVKAWSDAQFGKYRTAAPMAYHLKKEVKELIEKLDDWYQGIYANSTEDGIKLFTEKTKEINFEYADCMILLLDSAAHFGTSADKLLEVCKDKLEICKNRKYGDPDENGAYQHLKE